MRQLGIAYGSAIGDLVFCNNNLYNGFLYRANLVSPWSVTSKAGHNCDTLHVLYLNGMRDVRTWIAKAVTLYPMIGRHVGLRNNI